MSRKSAPSKLKLNKRALRRLSDAEAAAVGGGNGGGHGGAPPATVKCDEAELTSYCTKVTLVR